MGDPDGHIPWVGNTDDEDADDDEDDDDHDNDKGNNGADGP